MTDNRQFLAELTRMKVLFQARALAAAMGAPQPTKLPHNPDKGAA
jgi:hypothetical protein